MAGDTNFFIDFQKVIYSFGNGELPVTFQDLSVYIDIFDHVVQYGSYYQNYQVKNGERPDHVSQTLYNRPDYHWTFFLTNPQLRTSGWPMDNFRLYEEAKKYYPYITVMTMGSVYRRGINRYDSMCTSGLFDAGSMVWFRESELIGRIIKTTHDYGQLVIELIEPIQRPFPLEGRGNVIYAVPDSYEDKFMRYNTMINDPFVPGDDSELLTLQEDLASIELLLDFADIYGPETVFPKTETSRGRDKKTGVQLPARPVTYEWDSIHHFEDLDGEYIYPPYYAPNNLYEGAYALDWNQLNTSQSVTYLERLQILNDEQRAIEVIKPDVMNQVVSEFKLLLKR